MFSVWTKGRSVQQDPSTRAVSPGVPRRCYDYDRPSFVEASYDADLAIDDCRMAKMGCLWRGVAAENSTVLSAGNRYVLSFE